MTALDQLHLNTSAGFLQIGEPMDAWNELEMITPLSRAPRSKLRSTGTKKFAAISKQGSSTRGLLACLCFSLLPQP